MAGHLFHSPRSLNGEDRRLKDAENVRLHVCATLEITGGILMAHQLVWSMILSRLPTSELN